MTTTKKTTKKEVAEKVTKPLVSAEEKEKMRESSLLGRLEASKKRKAKAAAYELEKKNDHLLIAFFSGGTWHKMGGKSALYYANIIAPRLGLEVAIKPDRDFYFKFTDGTVSIRDIKDLKTNLATVNVKVKEENEFCTVFDLGFKVTKSQLQTIRNAREERINQVNQIVGTKELYPALASLSRKILKDFYTKMNHASANDRDFIMRKLAQIALENTVQLTLIANGYSPAEETLRSIHLKNEKLKSYMMLMMEISSFEPEDILRLETMLVDMNTQIKAELKKLETMEQKSASD